VKAKKTKAGVKYLISPKLRKKVKANIVDAREASQLSVQEASSQMGVTLSFLYQLESKENTVAPTLAVLEKMARTYRTKVARLVS